MLQRNRQSTGTIAKPRNDWKNTNRIEHKNFSAFRYVRRHSYLERIRFDRSWYNSKLDIQHKVKTQIDLFFVAEFSNRIIATAMFGYDGHRGWLNYFAVLPQFQNIGYGKELLEFGEKILFYKGCPKINLQIRADNKEAINFYNAVGFYED